MDLDPKLYNDTNKVQLDDGIYLANKIITETRGK